MSPNSFDNWAEPIGKEISQVYEWDDDISRSDAPALVELPSGEFLCSVPLAHANRDPSEDQYGEDRCLMFVSDDGGETWDEVSRLPFVTGRFLMPGEDLYFIGSGLHQEGLYIARSRDGGRGWSDPVCIREGSVYAASTGGAVQDGHVYWAVDDTYGSPRDRGVFAMAGDLNQDLLDETAWRFSEIETHPGLTQFLGRREHDTGKWLEPNLVSVGSDLHLVVRIRVKDIRREWAENEGGIPNVGAICDLSDEDGELELNFSHYVPLPGAQNHFNIFYDDRTDYHWMFSNVVTGVPKDIVGGWRVERRILMLHYSADAENWFTAGCAAMAPRTDQAYNYCTPIIDGDDLLFVSRTAKDAVDQHDNDQVTFHRIPTFRQHALNLFPRNEG